jgi:hypothetical protein
MTTGARSKSTEGPAIRSPSVDTHNRQLVSLHGDDTGATVFAGSGVPQAVDFLAI